MKWLITVQKTTDLTKLGDVIRDCGGELDYENPPIPLGEVEQIVQAQGPANLPHALKDTSGVIDVYPNSEMELY